MTDGMNKWPANDIGHPLAWLLGLLLITASGVAVFWIFFSVVGTLVSFATHCRGC